MALTKEQFQKARDSGFSFDQIVGFEKRRGGGQVASLKPSISSRVQPRESPGVLSLLTGTTPKQLAEEGKPIRSGLLQIGEDIYREGISPVLSGGSTFAFGIPKELVAGESKGAVFPEQKTLAGKALRFVSETAGWTVGGAVRGGKWLLKGIIKAAPKLAGKGSLKSIARAGVAGAGVGLSQTPEKGKGFLRPRERLEQTGTFGALGAGAAGVGAVGGIITKTGRWMAKNVGGVTDATVSTIKRLGADRVFEPAKVKADYIAQNLMPRAFKTFQDQVRKFTPSIQKFAEKSLNIPRNAISAIKKRGVDNVSRIRAAYGDSTDRIYQMIGKGFENKRKIADDAYKKAIDSYKGQIDSTSFFLKTQNILRKKGFIDLTGTPTSRYKSGLDPVLDDIATMYFDMKGGVTKQGKKILGNKISNEDFSLFRDKLGRLLRDRPSDRDIMKIRNSLYSSAEKSGMAGLKVARSLESRAFKAEKDLLKKGIINERKLDNYLKFTEEEARHLRKIEDYAGIKIVDDLEAITSSRYLDKFVDYNPEKIARDFIRARDPGWTKHVENNYKRLLGEKKAKPLLDDLMAHFANIDFELVTETPGAGGGFYPSRSGFIRKGVGGAARGYYKNVAPLIEKLGKKASFLKPKILEEVYPK